MTADNAALDDDDATVLCPDAHDVVHLVLYNGSQRCSICAAWNHNVTGKRLVWSRRLPHPFPTCVHCIFYMEMERRLQLAIRQQSRLAQAGVPWRA